MLDINHDGKVNADEMKSMLQKIGISVCDQTVNQLISYASKNGMIFISYENNHFISYLK
jgi:Ca2+-binding EF-hand superfamily protein